MSTGIVKRWNAEKGFGFIGPSGGGEDLFVHATDLTAGEGSVNEGDSVSYTEKYDERKGKYRAVEVAFLAAGVGKGSGGFGKGGGKGKGKGGGRSAGSTPGVPASGILMRWNEAKGYGFIKPDDDGEDVFCHVSALANGQGSIAEGEEVQFVKEFNDRNGKYQAKDVHGVGGGGGGAAPQRKGGYKGGGAPQAAYSYGSDTATPWVGKGGFEGGEY
jgi:cold shock CspA family protein